MASKVSSSSNLPWTWAIEALSGSNKVDTSLLIDIVKSAPEISDDLEKSVREAVTLRILEGLSSEEIPIQNNETSCQAPNPELEASTSPEDVLRIILEEMSATDPKSVRPEVMNWDVQSFIVHKRASFPMRALQKLKEAILEGGHSILASLKERSGLVVRTQSDNKLGDEESEDLSYRNSEPAETSAAATSDDNLGSETCEDQIASDDDVSEMVEQDSYLANGYAVENPIVLPLEVQSTNACREIIVYRGREKFQSQNEVEVGPSSHLKGDGKLEQNHKDINLLRVEKKCAAGMDFVKENRVSCQSLVTQNLRHEDRAGSSTLQNADRDRQGTAEHRNFLPSKRNRTIAPAENPGDSFDTCAQLAKKYKQDKNVYRENVVENRFFSPMRGISTIPSDMKDNLEREGHVGPIDDNGSFRDGDCQNAAPRTRRHLRSRSRANKHLPSQLEVEVEADLNKIAEFPAASGDQQTAFNEQNGHGGFHKPGPLSKISSGGLARDPQLENATDQSDGNLPRKASNHGEAKEYSRNLEKTSDSDEYHDERIANGDLFSQCTFSQDSYTTQSNSCIKCNGDGELLVCGSGTCQLMVHRSCLRSAGTFDENGKFYCPFCAYSRSVSEYLQVKKKAVLARKELAMFIGVKTDGQTEKSSLRTDRAMLAQMGRNGEIGKDNDENGEELNRASRSQSMQDNPQAEPPPQSSNGDNSLHGKQLVLTGGTATVSVKSNLEKEDLGQQLQSPGGNLKLPRDSELIRKSDNVCRTSNLIDMNKRNKEIHGKKICDSSKSTLPLEPLRESNTASAEEDYDKCAASRHSKRLRNHAVQYTDIARRKPLPWSKEEEETLKVGVRELTTIYDQKISWTKILEFGTGVFHKGRTAVDLKYKWRSMCKRSPVWP